MGFLGLYIATLTEWHKPFVKDLLIKWLIILKKYLTWDFDTILTEINILPSLAVKNWGISRTLLFTTSDRNIDGKGNEK